MSEGNKIDFKCTLLFGSEDNVNVEWEWRKNDTKLVDVEGKVKIVSNGNETTLTLSQVVDADKGQYECHVSTKHGEHSQVLQLRVKGMLLTSFIHINAI